MRTLRQARGWSLRELAKAAGMQKTSVGQVELDNTDPRLSTIQRLAAALGVDASVLVQGTAMSSTDEPNRR